MCATLLMCSFPHMQAFALTPTGVSRVQHPGERDLMGNCRCWSISGCDGRLGIGLVRVIWLSRKPVQCSPSGRIDWWHFSVFFPIPSRYPSGLCTDDCTGCIVPMGGCFFFPPQRRNETWSGNRSRGNSDLRLSEPAQQMSLLTREYFQLIINENDGR